MKRLSSDAFQAARSYLLTHGRPVDRALFCLQFEDGAVQPVVEALQRYVNDDGGFGHALEPDFRVTESSALATSVAFQKMRVAGVGVEHPLFRNAIGYLLDTVELNASSGGLGWRIIPDAARASSVASAPWWSRTLSEEERDDMLNPTAELLGYLIEAQQAGHDDARLDDTILAVTRLVLHDISERGEVLDGHDLLCLMRLLKTPGLPRDLKQAVLTRLQGDVPQAVLADPAKWGGYGLMPLSLVPEPDDALVAVLGQPLIDANLDYEIERQQPDGSWQPFWDWGPGGGAEWEHAKAEWSGELTLQMLLTLRGYGRLPESLIG